MAKPKMKPAPDPVNPDETRHQSEQLVEEHRSRNRAGLDCACVEPCGRGCWPPPAMIPVLFFEREACETLAREGWRPFAVDLGAMDPERVRREWVRLADDLDRTGAGFTVEARAAVDVLRHGSLFRVALADNDAAGAALAMLAVSAAALAGGFHAEAMKAARAAELARSEQGRKGQQAADAKREEARRFCIATAARWWRKQPDYRIGEVCEHLRGALRDKGLFCPKSAGTVKVWLKGAGEAGHLTIPDEASKPGRPSN